MHKIKNRTAPSSFLEKFEHPSHSYSTYAFQVRTTKKTQIKLRKCRFRISIRASAIWNDRSTEKKNSLVFSC